ncbi:MAG TPA: acyltransferase family protein [Azospira sp.]|nr:acyltransferase family protein [Azospira sp.]
MDYRREIDGVRALAVMPVILFHAGFQTFSGGFVGVDIFFVISGYLITSIILAEQQAGTFTLLNFYERRARRILPALFVVLLACLPFAWLWLLPSDMKEFSDSVFSVSTFMSNILFWRTSGYFDSATELKPLLHTWSLAVEEQYYLLFPVFLMLGWRFGKRWLVALLVLAALVSLAASEWGSIHKPPATFYLLPTRGWELLIGALTAFYLANDGRETNPGGFSQSLGHPLRQSLSILGLLLIAYAVLVFGKGTPFPSLYALVPTLGTALIILFATEQTLVGKLLGSKLFVGIGLVSYSAYLWHQPLFAFARQRSLEAPNPLLQATLAVAAVVLAYFSWKYVEVPFRNKRRFNRRQIFTYGAIGSACFMGLGALGHFTTGFVYRYQEGDRYLASLQRSEAGAYVGRRFDQLSMKGFAADDHRYRVLLIGDSYGQDLVNAVYESGYGKNLQMSTRHISHLCGNLFIEQTRFAQNIDPDYWRQCQDKGLYEDQNLRRLMLQADEIWFASSWQYWQAGLIAQSVANVEAFSGKPVKVFGPKDFGKVVIKELLAKPPQERFATRNAVREETIRTNALMQRNLSPTVFVDIQRLICGNEVGQCPLFTESGALISYDGHHLTKVGAKFYGDRLVRDGVLKSVEPPGPAPLIRTGVPNQGTRRSSTGPEPRSNTVASAFWKMDLASRP